jgi:hypothetical protein
MTPPRYNAQLWTLLAGVAMGWGAGLLCGLWA